VVCPCGTTTCAGRSKRELTLLSATGAPPAGAAAFSTNPHCNAPVELGSGEQDNCEMVVVAPPLRTKAIEAARELPLNAAVTVAAASTAITPAVTVNVAEAEPVGTTTDAGAVRTAVLVWIPTVPPPAGERVTVQ